MNIVITSTDMKHLDICLSSWWNCL